MKDDFFHPSMRRSERPNDHSLCFLRNTRPRDPMDQWTAYPTMAATLEAAQQIIDETDSSSWMWIEDGERLCVLESKATEWRLQIFPTSKAAIEAIAGLPPDYALVQIGAITQAMLPEDERPKKKKKRKPKPTPQPTGA